RAGGGEFHEARQAGPAGPGCAGQPLHATAGTPRGPRARPAAGLGGRGKSRPARLAAVQASPNPILPVFCVVRVLETWHGAAPADLAALGATCTPMGNNY